MTAALNETEAAFVRCRCSRVGCAKPAFVPRFVYEELQSLRKKTSFDSLFAFEELSRKYDNIDAGGNVYCSLEDRLAENED
ncbi:hypothetical protein KY308_00330 [Candidatus Woesearchaeota archaeon]|nr:hypothetical protein [Candidatus Woesearchaeota archaeon]